MREMLVPFVQRAGQVLGRIYPLSSGYARFAHLRWLERATLSDEDVVTTLRTGAQIVIRQNDFIGRTLYYLGDYDPKLTWICRRVLRPGDCAVDIGANAGVISLIAAGLVGERGAVHAIEPHPRLAAGLRRSKELNGYRQLDVHELALSEHDGELPLYVHPAVSAISSLVEGAVEGDESILVRVRRSGDFLNELGLKSIQLLKVDVERHEEQVLRGALEYLQSAPPAAICFESQNDGSPFFDRAPVRMLRELGYDIFEIPKVAFRVRLNRLEPGHVTVNDGFDFLAVHESAREVQQRLGVEPPRKS